MTADSPYTAEGLQWAWDSTALGLAKDCARKYYYSQIRGLRHKGDNVHLRFGTLYHAALELYDKLRTTMAHEEARYEVVATALTDSWPWPFDHNFKTRENLVRSIIWYLEEFRDDSCQTIILSNGKPAVELSFRLKLSDNITLCGHLDRVVRYGDSNYVMDRKTTGSSIGSFYFDKFAPDNQMSLYTLAARVVWETPVAGVIIDAAQIAVGFTRFTRGFTSRTESQTEEWLDDAIYHIKQTWDAAEHGYPMNDSACDKYGGCPFRKICAKDSSVREVFLKSDYDVRPWNPLESR